MKKSLSRLMCMALAFMMVFTASFVALPGLQDAVYADDLSFYDEMSVGLTNGVYGYLDEVYLDRYPEMGLRYKYGSDEEKAELQTLTDSIVQGKTSDMEKAQAICRWVRASLTYDTDGYSPFPIDTFRSRRGVCLNYAVLASTLIRLAGIPSVVVDGYRGDLKTVSASNLRYAGHAWLYAHIGDEWVMFDPLWYGGSPFTDTPENREFLASWYLISTIEGIFITYDGMPLYNINYFSSSAHGSGAVYYNGIFKYAFNGEIDGESYSPDKNLGNTSYILNSSIYFPMTLRVIGENGVQDGNSYVGDTGNVRKNQMTAGQLYADGWISGGDMNYLYENGVAKTSSICKEGDDTLYFTKSGTAWILDPALSTDDRWTEDGGIVFRTGTKGKLLTIMEDESGSTDTNYEYVYSLYKDYGDDHLTVTGDGYLELNQEGDYEVIIRRVDADDGTEYGWFNTSFKVRDTRPVPDYSQGTIDLTDFTVELSYYDTSYTGQENRPEVTVYESNVRVGGVYPELTEGVDYTVEYQDNIMPGYGKVIITGIGIFSGTHTEEFYISHEHVWDEGSEGGENACENEWVKTYTCTLCSETRTETMGPLGHVWGDWTLNGSEYIRSCSRCGKQEFKQVDPGTDPGDDPGTDPGDDPGTDPGTDPSDGPDITRIAGSNRYATAIEAADHLKEKNGISKFDSIIVASGAGFPDALSASYLAYRKDGPILLVNSNTIALVTGYINENLAPGGTVYIVGGTGAVPEAVDQKISGTVKRLAGSNRYDTNLEVLKEAGIDTEDDVVDILVASGTGFADALSASAAGEPILLVGQALTPNQIDYLSAFVPKEDEATYWNLYFDIIGGTGAVSQKIEDQLKPFGGVERISGSNRYATSIAVAERFFPGKIDTVVIANGKNFPDGLSGGPVAAAYDAPLILVIDTSYDHAQKYFTEEDASKLVIMGGTGAISDATAERITGGTE